MRAVQVCQPRGGTRKCRRCDKGGDPLLARRLRFSRVRDNCVPGVFAVCCHLFRFLCGQCADARTVRNDGSCAGGRCGTIRLAGGETCLAGGETCLAGGGTCAACPPCVPVLSHACRFDNDTCGLFWCPNAGCREASPERARHYLKLAAAHGSAEANGMLGRMYVSGCGAPGGRQTMKNATEGLGAPLAAEPEPFFLPPPPPPPFFWGGGVIFFFLRRQRHSHNLSSHPRTSMTRSKCPSSPAAATPFAYEQQ
jgi:hypothetical protein